MYETTDLCGLHMYTCIPGCKGFLDPVPKCVCVCRHPHTNKQFLEDQQSVQEFSSVPTISTQTKNQVLQLKGSIPQCFLPFQTPDASPGFYLCFWPTSGKCQVPMTPSSGSIDLLAWLTELWKTCVFTRLLFSHEVVSDSYQFIIKGCVLEDTNW